MTASPLIKCLCSRRHLPNLRFGIRGIRLTRIPMMDALGTSSCSNSSHFPSNMPANTVTPVTFPPVA